MLKKLLSPLLFTLFTITSVQAADYQAGTHYKEISQQASSKPQVEEVFSYWCPACYRFEPIVKEIKADLPKEAKFSKLHADFMGFASPELQRDLTKAMYVAKALKVSEKINKAIFNHIHIQRKKIQSVNDVRDIFIAQGIDGAKYDKALKSFSVNGWFKKNQKIITKYRGRTGGVPAFVVNGKYLVENQSMRSADDLKGVINYLLAKTD